jgi:uncharacterized Zn finger protein
VTTPPPRDGPFGRTWWGRAWVEALEERAQLDPSRLPRGIAYSRSGNVGEILVAPGEVRASVEGRMREPYQVRVRVRVFDDDQWAQVLDAIASRLAHAAAMLEGDLPVEVAADIAEAGLSLLPGAGEIGPRCTCPDEADPCKHAAAVCYLVADALDADPFVALLLRGRTRAEVLAGVRTRRRDLDRDDATAADVPQAAGLQQGPEASGDRPGSNDGDPPVLALTDSGVDARAAFAAAAAAATEGTPTIPNPVLPPVRPGRPVGLPVDPPAELSGLRADLSALAADAVRRAWELAVGTSSDAGLGLDARADLARRAASVLGTTGLAALSARSGVPERELVRRALAWRHGGADGLDVLGRTWDPATEGDAGTGMLLADARAALRTATGGPARLRHNRLSAAELQLRLGLDYRWYPYRRVGPSWEPAGPPHPDPVAAAGALLRPGG